MLPMVHQFLRNPLGLRADGSVPTLKNTNASCSSWSVSAESGKELAFNHRRVVLIQAVPLGLKCPHVLEKLIPAEAHSMIAQA